MKERGFSLVEIMVVLTLSSIVFLLVYSMIGLGVRFLENFSSKANFSVTQLVRDIEYELMRGNDFYLSNRIVFIEGEYYNVRYSFGFYDKSSDSLKVKKEVFGRGGKNERSFYLRNAFEVNLEEIRKGNVKKVFISIISSSGRVLYEGYLP